LPRSAEGQARWTVRRIAEEAVKPSVITQNRPYVIT